METTLLSPVHVDGKHEDHELVDFHKRAAASLLHAARGLEELSPAAAAAYLTQHPRLFSGVSYLPNLITTEMLDEAVALSEDAEVKRILLDTYGKG